MAILRKLHNGALDFYVEHWQQNGLHKWYKLHSAVYRLLGIFQSSLAKRPRTANIVLNGVSWRRLKWKRATTFLGPDMTYVIYRMIPTPEKNLFIAENVPTTPLPLHPKYSKNCFIRFEALTGTEGYGAGPFFAELASGDVVLIKTATWWQRDAENWITEENWKLLARQIEKDIKRRPMLDGLAPWNPIQ